MKKMSFKYLVSGMITLLLAMIYALITTYFSSKNIQLRHPYYSWLVAVFFVPFVCFVFYSLFRLYRKLHSRSLLIRIAMMALNGIVVIWLGFGLIILFFTPNERVELFDGVEYVVNTNTMIDEKDYPEGVLYFKVKDKYFYETPWAFTLAERATVLKP